MTKKLQPFYEIVTDEGYYVRARRKTEKTARNYRQRMIKRQGWIPYEVGINYMFYDKNIKAWESKEII